ncbi:hypothetical protein OG607_13400 [Streptomyces sp. NBC_01537]|uniref:hypothetical protein n=1 Tax=Streptomyces sp. NBC_01537 TaxID=2903896 RepID=UPI003866D866
MVLNATTLIAGNVLTFVGKTFKVGESVAARFAPEVRTGADRPDPTLLAVVKADGSGEASGSVTIPRRTPTGSYSFSLTGSESGLYLSAIITVTGLPGGPGDGPGHHYRPGQHYHYSSPGFPWLPGFTGFADDARAGAGSAPVNVDTVPVANHVKEPENAKGRTLAVAGAAAALGAFGGGAYLMRRRRRG